MKYVPCTFYATLLVICHQMRVTTLPKTANCCLDWWLKKCGSIYLRMSVTSVVIDCYLIHTIWCEIITFQSREVNGPGC